MSNIIRKMERKIVRANVRKESGSNKGFEAAWKAYREQKYVTKDEEGNVISDLTPKNTMPKKQIHFDNAGQYANLLAFAEEQEQEREAKKDEQ